MSNPDSVQKALPQQSERFLVFFGARRRRVGGLGRASALVALGRSWGKPLVWSRRSRILELTLIVGSAGLLDPMSSQGGLESY